MHIHPGQHKIFLTNLLVLLAFTAWFIISKNVEFIFYIFVMVFFGLVILFSNKKIHYPNDLLWLLSLWAWLHMAGGGLFFQGTRFYEIILIPLSATYPIIRYDQVIHAYGFFTATLVVWHLLKPLLKSTKTGWVQIFIIVTMAGLGLGALNEIVEFIATIVLNSTGVGGYLNTSLDLVSNWIGALIAFVYIKKTSLK